MNVCTQKSPKFSNIYKIYSKYLDGARVISIKYAPIHINVGGSRKITKDIY